MALRHTKIIFRGLFRKSSKANPAAIANLPRIDPKPSTNPAVVEEYLKKPEDVVTHTGQKWEADDYRMSRYLVADKQVNKQWAINLIDEIPPQACKDRVVSCDGGGGPLGHPKVYINLDQPGNHSCNYCGLRFYLDHDHHH
ncbi:probable NADH dehydrogenase [ubiquinone] iron-sulfur protein 6, mitochondrial [Lingula anatina]|uniref:Probable NADH dehydrogenase [ubiquinone] iron-sulfur protein 6, mitochondrial n=1 Tax=Lingula anatina TaxID=7574 RepID=A0A1S3IE50_LINAN|nr:probable NADH dehydrogenase [ubiquinone] iron-sulfur protein 6, mitochondrial [Lingula anatina]XP_013396132.1 probable NADH dehydrogenase [ubiquinone] iron-sulfur protein 6, mitochondrial [Lingula anatina]|eukprot:XP_013396131.1 probable NADH dehydrogenase [ubiquinone] iron-sulfur protein 6, mitochondrial [Lingula anatina]